MKKLSILLLGFLFFTACTDSEPDINIGEPALESVTLYDIGFTEKDETARQYIYGYFGDVFYFDKASGVKTGIGNVDVFENDFSAVIGGNILGVKKLELNTYQVDAVIFEDDNNLQYTFEIEMKAGDEPIISSLKVKEKVELEFEESTLVDNLESPSKRYEARVEKNLIAVDFYTTKESVIPAYLGRYELILVDNVIGTEYLVDYSFDPFSTNLPLELGEFENDEDYFTYYEQGLGRLFNIYDVENKDRTDIELAGIYDAGFWYKDRYVVCTSGGDFTATITLIEPGKWHINDHYFIYPEALNEAKNADEVWDLLVNYSESLSNAELDCSLKNGVLEYHDPTGSGEILNFDLEEDLPGAIL